MQFLLFFFLLVSCTQAAAQSDNPNELSLKTLPPEILMLTYEFLHLYDSLKINTLLKNDDQNINPLSQSRLRSGLNPFTSHAVTDGQDAIDLMKKAPDHLLRDLLSAYLRNPTLKSAIKDEIMKLAVSSENIDILDAFSDYYNDQQDIYFLALCRIMGTRDQDSLERLFRHPKILRLLPNAGLFALAGAYDSDSVTNFEWLLNRLSIDPSRDRNIIFRNAINTGRLDLARILLNDVRVRRTLDFETVTLYNYLWTAHVGSLSLGYLSRLWFQITSADVKLLLIFFLLSTFIII
jgi:hypothetical protein